MLAALASPTAVPASADTAVGVVGMSPTIAAGESHSLVLKEDGSLWSFGHNGDGQLGRNQSDGSFAVTATPAKVMTGVAAVAAGDRHSLVLKTDGSLWSFGSNGNGELGRLSQGIVGAEDSTPTQVMTGVSAIAAGALHSLY